MFTQDAVDNPRGHRVENAAATGATNEVSLLGGFAFFVGGDTLIGVPPGSQRLLAYLALHGRVVTRHQVAGTFWPKSSEEHAGASLRSALSRLDRPTRRAVEVTAADLGLGEGVLVDFRHAESLARRLIGREAPLTDTDIGAPAVTALSRDLLPGWYEDWALLAAEDWRQLRLHALEAVAARLTAAARLAEAAVAAVAAVRAEPLRESARAALIRVHMAEGNQSAALGEFASYRLLLNAEFGIEPTPRLSQILGGLEQPVISCA
ncbi:MAG: SARP family transcriptional regulator [Actinobacteria bacterium]|nr:SARP family transcriptional regulator [Actinomycetota bacterium]